MKAWTLKDYKDLLEDSLKAYNDPMNCPFGMDPHTDGVLWRKAKQEAILFALEMLPEIKDE